MFCTTIAENRNEMKDSVLLRVTYDSSVEFLEEVKDQTSWTVDVGSTSAVFYSRPSRCIRKETAGLDRSSYEYYEKYHEARAKYGSSYQHEYAVNIPAKGLYTAADYAGPNFLTYTDSLPTIEWQLQDSVKTVCSYECSKAVGHLYGHTWTVWYTTDIPISYGPYILGGLPGLILAASESEGHFSFEATSIEKPSEHSVVELQNAEEAKKCNRRQMLKMRKEFSEMSNADYLKRALGNDVDVKSKGITVLKDGKEVTQEKVKQQFHFDKE